MTKSQLRPATIGPKSSHNKRELEPPPARMGRVVSFRRARAASGRNGHARTKSVQIELTKALCQHCSRRSDSHGGDLCADSYAEAGACARTASATHHCGHLPSKGTAAQPPD